jgi:hypothetical protein
MVDSSDSPVQNLDRADCMEKSKVFFSPSKQCSFESLKIKIWDDPNQPETKL